MVDVLRSHPGVIHSFDAFRSRLTCRPKVTDPVPPALSEAESPQSGTTRLRLTNAVLSFYRKQLTTQKHQLPPALSRVHHPPACHHKPCLTSLLALVKPDLLRGEISYESSVYHNLAFLKSSKTLKALGNPLGTKFTDRINAIRHRISRDTAKAGAKMLRALLRDGKPIFGKDGSPDMKALKKLWQQLLGSLKKGQVPSGFVLPFAHLDTRRRASGGDLRKASTLTIQCPANADFYEPVPVSGTLTPARGGTTVQVTYSQPGAASTTHAVTTDDFGNYADSFTPMVGTVVTAQARFAGDAERKPAASPSCTPKYPGFG
jgi:hypothetical protein